MPTSPAVRSGPDEHTWTVDPTASPDRAAFINEFCVILPSSESARIGVDTTYVVIGRDAGDLGRLAVIARVGFDDWLPHATLRMDQTLRQALGGFGSRFTSTKELSFHGFVEPLHLSPKDRRAERLARSVGIRQLVVRACPTDVGNIEKDLVLLDRLDLLALGVRSGERLVLTTPRHVPDTGFELIRFSVTALDQSESFLEERRKLERQPGTRYISPNDLRDPDLSAEDEAGKEQPGCELHRMQIDHDLRQRCGISQVSPVVVRRDTKTVVLREIQDFGVALLGTLFGFSATIKLVLDAFVDLPDIASIGIGFVLAAAVTLLLLRSRLRNSISDSPRDLPASSADTHHPIPPHPSDPVRRAEQYPYRLAPLDVVVSPAKGTVRRATADDLAAAIATRTAVIAIGSNGAPSQLVEKFSGSAETDADVVVARATWRYHDAVYAARISPYGAIPATSAPSERCDVSVPIIFLDDAQLSRLDATEGAPDAYRRDPVDTSEVVLANGPTPAVVHAYVATAGPLTIDGTEIALRAIAARRRMLPELTEREVLRVLEHSASLKLDDLVGDEHGANRAAASDALAAGLDGS